MQVSVEAPIVPPPHRGHPPPLVITHTYTHTFRYHLSGRSGLYGIPSGHSVVTVAEEHNLRMPRLCGDVRDNKTYSILSCIIVSCIVLYCNTNLLSGVCRC